MTNPMINPQPNYSGVTIQIANPAVNVGNSDPRGINPAYANNIPYYQGMTQPAGIAGANMPQAQEDVRPAYPTAYPPQYYLNNYNYQTPENSQAVLKELQKLNAQDKQTQEAGNTAFVENQPDNQPEIVNTPEAKPTKEYEVKTEEPQDFSKSQAVIDDLDARAAAAEAEKKNSKQKRVVALTDEYIKSLENYLNNPNDEIRLMASKEILTRLDEDKDRYNDAALNALLNKMLQDPSKLIRVAALSAFASQLASGNDYTVQLLHNIQSNPSADKEDVVQAADILLKMSAGTEIKNIPNPAVKNETPEETEKVN